MNAGSFTFLIKFKYGVKYEGIVSCKIKEVMFLGQVQCGLKRANHF